jgi:hypothetical protein
MVSHMTTMPDDVSKHLHKARQEIARLREPSLMSPATYQALNSLYAAVEALAQVVAECQDLDGVSTAVPRDKPAPDPISNGTPAS